MRAYVPVLVVALAVALPWTVLAVSPTADELVMAHDWMNTQWMGGNGTNSAAPPLSFICNGKPSAELLGQWGRKRSRRTLDRHRTEHTLTYTDPKTGLALHCVGVEYGDFPTVEWTLYFRNTSGRDTPILEDIQSLDLQLERPAANSSEFRLRQSVGSPCSSQDYGPLETILTPKMDKTIAGGDGRHRRKN